MREKILVSGVKATYTSLTGKHQRLLSENEGKNFATTIYDVMADVVKSVGSLSGSDLSPKFFSDVMLEKDRRDLQVAIRMYSMNDEPLFSFDFKYDDAEGRKKVDPVDIRLEYDEDYIDEDTGQKKTRTVVGCPCKPYYKQWTEYSEIDRAVVIILPDCKKEVQFFLLNGVGAKLLQTTPKKKRSTHTLIEMHTPCYKELTDKSFKWISLDLDDLTLKDIEFLRSEIRRHEGFVDTEVVFLHPVTQEKQFVDIVGQVTFFYPSGAI